MSKKYCLKSELFGVLLLILFNANLFTLVFSVKDSGIGISDDEKDRIFSQFYRASNAKALRPYGTGLNLYFAKFYAEKMGGKVWFESKENEGSVFHFSIPLK